MSAKTTTYRKGDAIKVRKVSLELDEVTLEKIAMPDEYRGLQGVVAQVREFDKLGFQATIAVELENGQVIATEQHHLRLLKRAPKE